MRIDPVTTYWRRVSMDGPVGEWRPDLGPCWPWTGPVNNAGYGYAWNGAQPVGAHVLAVLLAGRTVPAGWEVDHLCAVRHCVRGTHLEVVPAWLNHARAAYRARVLRHRAWVAELAAMGQQELDLAA